MATSTISLASGARKAQVDDQGIVIAIPNSFSGSGAQLFKALKIESRGTADQYVFVKFGTSTLTPAQLTAWLTLIALIKVTGVDVSATYTVNLDGQDYDYPAQGGDGAQQIVDGLIAAIPGGTYSAINVANELIVERLDNATFPVTVAATGSGSLSVEDRLASGGIAIANGSMEEVGLSPADTHVGLICPTSQTADVVLRTIGKQAIPEKAVL